MDELYFFINYLESDDPPSPADECVSLNGGGWLYIGYAERTQNIELVGNTFLNLADAKQAIYDLKMILKAPKVGPA